MKLDLYNEDCMDVMSRYPDNYFDLAVVDPPYGIGADGNKATTGDHGGRKAHEKKGWDSEGNRPDCKYFTELLRVSRNQVIWGANYYPQYLKPSMGWILWDKGQRINQSDGELAYTSFNKALRVFTLNRVALLIEGTIHPTQKPVELYKWIYENYATEGMRILDTHLGSGSNAIAAYEMNMAEFVGAELDADYFKAASARIERAMSQGKLF